MKRDFLKVTEFSSEEIHGLFETAARLKKDRKEGRSHNHLLAGKSMSLIFQKPSLRTRVSFETGFYDLGGHAVYLAPHTIGFGKRESVRDIGQVLSRYNHIIMARVFAHADVEELARESSVPVMNGLSDACHPCQISADALTVWEHLDGEIEGAKILYTGEGNNVCHSWLNLSQRIALDLRIACPKGYEPDEAVLAEARAAGKSQITVAHDVREVVEGVDIVYTDVWASMGQEDQLEQRKKDFADFQVNGALMKAAGPQAKFMHDLPANRGLEATDEVMDSPQSIIYDEAENRMHIQKAIILKLLGVDY